MFRRFLFTIMALVFMAGLVAHVSAAQPSLNQIYTAARPRTSISVRPSNAVLVFHQDLATARSLPGAGNVTRYSTFDAVEFPSVNAARTAVSVLQRRGIVCQVNVAWGPPIVRRGLTRGFTRIPGSYVSYQVNRKTTFAPYAPDLGRGVRVGLVDTGVDYTHPALRGRVVRLFDVGNMDTDPMDRIGHGTHVAGIIAGNGEIQGLAPAATIYVCKMFSDAGGGSDASFAEGLHTVINARVHMINLSVGRPEMGYPAPMVADAIDRAIHNKVIVVAAAGNDTANVSDDIPSKYQGVVSVGAATPSRVRCFFSNWGEVTLYAPGWEVLSTVPFGYQSMSGTSMAAPCVVGALAALKSRNPGLSNNALVARLLATSDVVQTWKGETARHLNLGRALAPSSTYQGVSGYCLDAAQTTTVAANLRQPVAIEVVRTADGQTILRTQSDSIGYWWLPLPVGDYTVRFRLNRYLSIDRAISVMRGVNTLVSPVPLIPVRGDLTVTVVNDTTDADYTPVPQHRPLGGLYIAELVDRQWGVNNLPGWFGNPGDYLASPYRQLLRSTFDDSQPMTQFVVGYRSAVCDLSLTGLYFSLDDGLEQEGVPLAESGVTVYIARGDRLLAMLRPPRSNHDVPGATWNVARLKPLADDAHAVQLIQTVVEPPPGPL